jgi:ribokinase
MNAAGPTAILVANELPHACLEVVFQAANERGIPVWFNVAPYSGDACALVPMVDTLIVNRGEAEDILNVRGGGKDVAGLATGLRELGAKNVIITLGSDGVFGYHGEREYVMPAEEVTPVDTTGAGDTFCGAWAAEILRGATFEEALAYGNRAAAISVTRHGAQSSIPTRAEIEASQHKSLR